MDAVVISDLHLGSPACQTNQLEQFIKGLSTATRLILNGDVLDSTVHRLNRSDWGILTLLRKVSKRTELVWVQGNHDIDAEKVAELIGATFVNEYLFKSGEAEILCVHGDRWDNFMIDRPWATWMGDTVYQSLYRISPLLATLAKRKSKTFMHCCWIVKEKATRHCRTIGATAILCGHTHQAHRPCDNGECYFNSGCWTEYICHYLTVKDGVVELLAYENK